MKEETRARSRRDLGVDKPEVKEKEAILQIAYCVKCKKKVVMLNDQQVTLKGGRSALQGFCPDCGTKVFRITGKTIPE